MIRSWPTVRLEALSAHDAMAIGTAADPGHRRHCWRRLGAAADRAASRAVDPVLETLRLRHLAEVTRLVDVENVMSVTDQMRGREPLGPCLRANENDADVRHPEVPRIGAVLRTY